MFELWINFQETEFDRKVLNFLNCRAESSCQVLVTSVSSQLTISQAKLFLNLNCTLYGFGWRARPGIISLGSRCVKISSEGFVTVQICIKVAKNKNARFFAKTSPMHARLPNPNINKLQKSKYKFWSLYP